MLQVPELMRAMGFSGRDFSLDGVRQRRNRIKLLGNGVTPPVMEAIVRMLMRSAEREADRKHRAGNSPQLFEAEGIRYMLPGPA
jgi:DNA (cytosine-5)-methyltransferase 1